MKSPTTLIELENREGTVLVKLNRPEKRNALNDEVVLGLEQVFAELPSSARCAIIYGVGKHFSAGLDLSELKERDVVQGLYHSRMWHRALDKIQYASVPVIAALHGGVIGGGLELAAACHLRVAEHGTFYALPEGQRGIFVGGGASVRLPRLIGLARVTDMMLTGRVYGAEEGESIGLAQYLVAENQGLTKSLELASKIAANTGMTNYALVQALPRIAEAGPQEGLLLESLMAAISQNAPEAKARLRDFLEGKAPKVGH